MLHTVQVLVGLNRFVFVSVGRGVVPGRVRSDPVGSGWDRMG